MPRPKKEDKKPVEKPKAKATTKRRKDKEEDADDLEEFEEKPEKKLKVESQNKGKAKIAILTYFQKNDGYNCRTHTFKDLTSALAFREDLIKRFEDSENNEGHFYGYPVSDGKSKGLGFYADHPNGIYGIRIKEVTVEELLAGEDVNIEVF